MGPDVFLAKRLSLSIVATLLLVIVLGLPRPVAAQEAPKAEISGGYEMLHLGNFGDETQTLPKGWYADIAGNLTRSVGLVFQVSGSYKTVQETITNEGVTVSATAHVRAYQFLGGIRINARPNKTVTPFGQFLVGAFRLSGEASVTATQNGETVFQQDSSSNSSTNLAVQAGGGFNVLLTRRVGVRAGADYIRVFHKDDGLNALRFVVGAVVAF